MIFNKNIQKLAYGFVSKLSKPNVFCTGFAFGFMGFELGSEMSLQMKFGCTFAKNPSTSVVCILPRPARGAAVLVSKSQYIHRDTSTSPNRLKDIQTRLMVLILLSV